MLQPSVTKIDRWRYKLISSYCIASVLDIGCGQMGLAEYLSENSYTGCDIEGGDIRASVHALPFRDKAFDTVVMGEILEHLGNPLSALEQAAAVAKQRIIVTVPNDYSLVRLSRLIAGRETEIEAEHILSYNSWNLAGLFGRVGFKVRESFCFPLRLQLFPELPIKSRFGYWLFSIADRE